MYSPADQSVAIQDCVARKPGAEPIPGYRLVRPLGRGGYGDVWKCVAPGGIAKAVKFVNAVTDHIAAGRAPADLELAALQRFRDIRHPFLLSLDRIELAGPELVIVTELADGSLDELKTAHQDRGFPGIPREELLGLLAEAADALDFISQTHQLQHLDIKPQNLLLVSRHVKVADFGLVQSLQETTADSSAPGTQRSTPVYAAPETFQGRFSKHSDQYSLAIVYVELLTGVRPFDGKTARQLMVQHLTLEPNLTSLPQYDRQAIRRALSKDPAERFPSSVALIQALGGCQPASVGHLSLPEFQLEAAETPRIEVPTPLKAPADVELPNLERITDDATATEDLHADQVTPADLEFVEYLGQNRLAEVWRARAADGSGRLARRLNHGDRISPARLHRLEEFEHPHVLPVEVLKDSLGRWYLVSPHYRRTLRDRLHDCRGQGMTGIPRQELIDSLSGVAAALDTARYENGLTHLGLNPRRLVLHDDRTQVTDLGLIQAFWDLLIADGRRVMGSYDAPEVIDGKPGPTSDLYSLALIYVELVTGCHPRLSTGARNGRCRDGLDLDGLTMVDRAVIQVALHPDPKRRFASCLELIEALGQAHQPPKAAQGTTVAVAAPAVWAEALEGHGEQRDYPPPAPQELQVALLRTVTGGVTPCQGPGFRYLLQPDGSVEHRFRVQLYRGGLQLRLQGFADQWHAMLLGQNENSAEVLLPLSRTLLQRCLGQQPGLRMRIEMTPQPGTELFHGCVTLAGLDHSTGVRRAMAIQAPRLLTSLRAFLQARPEQRAEERWPCVRPAHFYPVYPDQRIGKVMEGKTRDLAHLGLGLTLKHAPPTERGYVLLPGNGPLAECALLTRIIRSRAAKGGYEIGARYVVEEGT